MASKNLWRERPAFLEHGGHGARVPSLRHAILSDPASDLQPAHAPAVTAHTINLIVAPPPDVIATEKDASLNAHADPVIRTDAAGGVTGWNRSAEALFGYTAREVLGKWLPTIPPEEAERWDTFRARVLAGETITNVEAARIHKDGSLLTVLLTAAPWYENGAVVGIVTTLKDLSAYKARLKELARQIASERRRARDADYSAAVAAACTAATDEPAILQALADCTADWADCAGVVICDDAHSRLVAFASSTPDANGPLAALFEACATGFRDLSVPDAPTPLLTPRVHYLREIPLSSEPVARGYHTLASVPIRVAGEVNVVLYAAARSNTPPFDAGSLTTLDRATVHAGNAISRIRTLNALRTRLDTLEATSRHKDEFLATVSHELRTPLTAILGFAHIIVENDALGAERRRGMAEDIVASGGLLLTQVNDLLDIVQLGAGRLKVSPEAVEVISVVRWCERAVRGLMHTKGLEFNLVIPSELPLVRANTARVQQVILNFLVNAYKFTPGGGTVTLEAKERDGAVMIAVRDTGIGIAPEHAARIFEPFERIETEYTRTQAGAGVGLAVARQLVEMMDGEITLDSTLGVGSAFTVTLKMAE